jgi:hypothetical protein
MAARARLTIFDIESRKGPAISGPLAIAASARVGFQSLKSGRAIHLAGQITSDLPKLPNLAATLSVVRCRVQAI